MNQSDEEILRRVQRGERSAYLELFDRYYPRIQVYAQSQLHNSEAAHDITSETFLRAYRNVHEFRIGEQISYAGYLFLICRRLIYTERQRQQSSPLVPLESLFGENMGWKEGAHAEEGALSHLLDTEKCDMVQNALRQLAKEDREIIQLAFERDLSRRDIARILGKPTISAVTSHLHRAMRKLKAVLVRQEYFVPERETERT